MDVSEPNTKQVVTLDYFREHIHIGSEVSEGEVTMSQEQKDAYEAILGDANASVTVSRSVAHKVYGSGGDVFVSITLKCDQSVAVVTAAVEYAKQLADHKAWEYYEQLKPQLISRGLLQA